MSSVLKALLFVTAAFIFLSAATYSIETFSMFDRSYDHIIKRAINDTIDETREVPNTVTTIKGSDIVHQLYQMNTVGVPISVDGYTYPVDIDITKINFSAKIDINAQYHFNINRDDQGKMTELIYFK